MKTPVIEKYLEEKNNTYMFLALSNLESKRLHELPEHMKKKFNKKITTLAMQNVAENKITDYVAEQLDME